MNDKDEQVELVLCIRAKAGTMVLGGCHTVLTEAAFWHSLGYSTFIAGKVGNCLTVVQEIPNAPTA